MVIRSFARWSVFAIAILLCSGVTGPTLLAELRTEQFLARSIRDRTSISQLDQLIMAISISSFMAEVVSINPILLFLSKKAVMGRTSGPCWKLLRIRRDDQKETPSSGRDRMGRLAVLSDSLRGHLVHFQDQSQNSKTMVIPGRIRSSLHLSKA